MYNRSDLHNEDACEWCNRKLADVDEIHSVEGLLFCTKGCAVNYKRSEIIDLAGEQAAAWYNDFAEVVTPEDIGIDK